VGLIQSVAGVPKNALSFVASLEGVLVSSAPCKCQSSTLGLGWGVWSLQARVWNGVTTNRLLQPSYPGVTLVLLGAQFSADCRAAYTVVRKV
jgi:hypothetical protein